MNKILYKIIKTFLNKPNLLNEPSPMKYVWVNIYHLTKSEKQGRITNVRRK